MTEAGTETDLTFNQGLDLPHFASFPLLLNPSQRQLLQTYATDLVDLGRADKVGVVLETATWRASQDWGDRLGFSTDQLNTINRDAVRILSEIRASCSDVPTVISGTLGPRGDGYVVASAMGPEEASEYHSAQIETLVEAGVDLVSAFTINYAAETIGIVNAADSLGIPVVISLTVETNGRLPSGQTRGSAIEEVDSSTNFAAAYFMLNCAHPNHMIPILSQPGPWHRVQGIRANASKMSHAEPDNATELDRGDEKELAAGYVRLAELLPQLNVVGGCCGTDSDHLTAILSRLQDEPAAQIG